MRRETYETPGRVKLDLRAPAGRIDVETVPGTKTEVELEVLGGGGADLLDDARIELRETGDGHEVVVHVGNRGFGRFWQRADVRLSVRAPADAHLKVSGASADIRARGRLGSLEAEAASGDIEVDDVAGDATARTASGDVTIRSAGGSVSVNSASGNAQLGKIGGAVTVKTASGDARIEEAATDVEIATASGDLRLDAVTSGKVDLKSASGDMRIGIREGSSLWVDARAMSGDLSSEVELGDAPADGPGDGPHVELHAVSMSGDISVVRASAPVAH